MRRFRLSDLLWVVLGLAATVRGEAITPIGIVGTSEFGAIDIFGDESFSDVFVIDLIDGGGLMDLANTPDNVLDDLHDNDAASTNGWHAGDFDAGLPGGTDGDGEWLTPPAVDQQVLEFDLGGLFDVSRAHIWQQNQGPFVFAPSAPDRGVDQFQIWISPQASGDDFAFVGRFQLEPETGFDPVPAQVVELGAGPHRAQRIRFHIETAHSGEVYEFVGLSEVRFEGTAAGVAGDFNQDGRLTAEDIDLLNAAVRGGDSSSQFDVNQDGQVSTGDRDTWVEELKSTWFGDADLDGEFSTADLIAVLVAGQYEDLAPLNSTWATGDWDGDGDFSTSDLVIALSGGGFERGPRAAVAAVPEPAGVWLFVAAFAAVGAAGRRGQQRG